MTDGDVSLFNDETEYDYPLELHYKYCPRTGRTTPIYAEQLAHAETTVMKTIGQRIKRPEFITRMKWASKSLSEPALDP